MWCEMPLYNKMRDNPSPAGGHPQWLECYLCGPRAAAGTPANLALSKECQWVMKLFLKYGTVMTTNALWAEIEIHLLEICQRKEQITIQYVRQFGMIQVQQFGLGENKVKVFIHLYPQRLKLFICPPVCRLTDLSESSVARTQMEVFPQWRWSAPTFIVAPNSPCLPDGGFMWLLLYWSFSIASNDSRECEHLELGRSHWTQMLGLTSLAVQTMVKTGGGAASRYAILFFPLDSRIDNKWYRPKWYRLLYMI